MQTVWLCGTAVLVRLILMNEVFRVRKSKGAQVREPSYKTHYFITLKLFYKENLLSQSPEHIETRTEISTSCYIHLLKMG